MDVAAADSGHDGDMNVMRGVHGDRSPVPSASATTQLSVYSAPLRAELPPYPGSR